MSIKSLLQLILLLLIIVILGGIYSLYFYKGPLKNKEVSNNALIEIDNSNKNLNSSTNDEILEEIKTNKKDKNYKNEENENILTNKKKNNKKGVITLNKNNKNQLDKKDENDKIKNLTKNIEYITSNKNGDIFKVIAEYAKTNLDNKDILDLENVNGNIKTKEKNEILISSKYASYNHSSQNSKFYQNVKIVYQNKVITCDNLDISISQNIAVGYDNVILEEGNSIMKAKKITMNLLTKDISINSDNKIELKIN